MQNVLSKSTVINVRNNTSLQDQITEMLNSNSNL